MQVHNPADFFVFADDQQHSHVFRRLTEQERNLLIANGCQCCDWDKIEVCDPFDARLIERCRFFGQVQIGSLQYQMRQYDGLSLPVGLYDSVIGNSWIGDNCAVHRVLHMQHCRVGRDCLLFNIGAILTASPAHFGTAVCWGDIENQPSIEVVNENGRRRIVPFLSMRVGDAFLFASDRFDECLQKKIMGLARAEFCGQTDMSLICDGAVVCHVKQMRNVRLGALSIVSGADVLDNVTILSSTQQPTFVGSGVQLQDGLVHCGCRIQSGAKARRFVLGENCTLELDARVNHLVLGDNSTIACCEVQHSLIFPSHQQHHNNSFLIAALLGGQSNVAAGATLGSNHNSRANDGELRAGRGFWPALCVSLKYPSRFASYVLVAKGDFPFELDIPLPFSLVSNNVAADRLEILPAYWWLYNLYALARNGYKFAQRDRRKLAQQKVEHNPLAPDTVEEIFAARRLLEQWALSEEGVSAEKLANAAAPLTQIKAPRGALERSDRQVVILRPTAAYHAYRQMILYFAVKTLLEAVGQPEQRQTAETLSEQFASARRVRWENIGGQIVAEDDLNQLKNDIRQGVLASWSDIHHRLDQLWQQYPLQKARYAYAALCDLNGIDILTEPIWQAAVEEFAALTEQVLQKIIASRSKDYDHPFYRKLFDNPDEMRAVLGDLQNDPFIQAEKKRVEELQKKAYCILNS